MPLATLSDATSTLRPSERDRRCAPSFSKNTRKSSGGFGAASRTLRTARVLLAVLAIGLALAFSSLAPRAQAADSMSPVEKYLSGDTVLLARAPDVTESRKRWAETAVGRAWSDPGVAYWRSMQLDPAIASLLGRVGLTQLAPSLKSVQGQVFLAVEPLPGATPRPAATAPGASPAAPTPGQSPAAAAKTAASPHAAGGLPANGLPFAVYFGADFGTEAAAARPLLAPAGATHEPTPEALRSSVAEIVVHPAPLAGAAPYCSAWVGTTWLVASSREALLDLLARRYDVKLPGAAAGERTALRSNADWKRLAGEAPAKADATIYADNVRLYEILSDSLARTMSQLGDPAQWRRTESLMEAVGLSALGQTFWATEMRGKAFYSRQVVTFRAEPKGLAFVTNPDRPLKTPEWMTRDVDSFSAVSIRSPLGFKQEAMSLIQQLAPEIAPMVQGAEDAFKARVGAPLDDLLGALGSEVAMVSRPGASGLPDATLLWEIRDAPLLRRTLQSIRTAFQITPTQASYGGYTYETQFVAPLPIPLVTAEIDGYFMFSTSDGWLKGFVDYRTARAAGPPAKDARGPAATQPLLPMLDEPFGATPRDMAVVERGYSNPGPTLLQANTFLPILVPVINMQLQAAKSPTIPSWAITAIPPLVPFASQAFPTVSRTVQNARTVITETYSAFDPIQTPIAAAAAVMLNSYLSAPPAPPKTAPGAALPDLEMPALRPAPAPGGTTVPIQRTAPRVPGK